MACNKVLEIDNCKWEAKEIKKTLQYIYILVTLSILLPFLFFYFNIFFFISEAFSLYDTEI